jgi:transposase
MDSRQLADALGVSTNQIYMWFKRSDRNGFPAPKEEKGPGERGRRQRNSNLWVANEVLTWHRHYVPSKGGSGTHRKNREQT